MSSSSARKARLNREVTPALTDLDAPVRIRGDLDLDPAIWDKAGVKATRARRRPGAGGGARRSQRCC